jgi:hypothetical protein
VLFDFGIEGNLVKMEENFVLDFFNKYILYVKESV